MRKTEIKKSQRSRFSALKSEKSLAHISPLQVNYTIYTNGSLSASTRNGGAAAVITAGPPVQPTVVWTIKTKGRSFTISYKEELAAWYPLYWVFPQMGTQLIICTNHQSLCETISACKPGTNSIWQSISSILSFKECHVTPAFLTINSQTDIIWHHPPYISITCFLGCQQNVPWGTTLSRPRK